MSKETTINLLESRIRTTIRKITDGSVTKADSNIGVMLARMKHLDEALYTGLVGTYKECLKKLDK